MPPVSKPKKSLKMLIKTRDNFKIRINIFNNHVQSLEKPLTEEDARALEMRINKIEEMYDQYNDVQLQLESLLENKEKQLTERSDFEMIYNKSLSDALSLLQDFNESQNQSNSAGNKDAIPDLVLPKFCGSLGDWHEFHFNFSKLVHCNKDYNDEQKFYYLKSCLEGSAATAIKSIHVTGDNYAVAWKRLCDTFDTNRQPPNRAELEHHVSALYNIAPIAEDSSAALRQLHEQLNVHLRALESLGEIVKQWSSILMHIISPKLDQNTIREWGEHKASFDPNTSITFDIFMKFLLNRANTIDAANLRKQSALQDKADTADL